jgi:hypothetical protein
MMTYGITSPTSEDILIPMAGALYLESSTLRHLEDRHAFAQKSELSRRFRVFVGKVIQ